MPLVPQTNYQPPAGFRNPHIQTIWAGKLRRVDRPAYDRERIPTSDGDFLDLDYVRTGASQAAVISHGLEGSSDRPYVRGMARALASRGWDVVAWNLRGCSGEPNRLARSYHSGDTADLHTVILHLLPSYDRLALIGFSLGGNLTLKYLGEAARDPRLAAAATFSVPVDLASSSEALARRANAHYMVYFMRSLRAKVLEKAERFPGQVDAARLSGVRTFRAFDEEFTAPIHGFAGAEDYWARASSLPFLAHIRVPTLLVNADDDPFLPPPCYPRKEAAASGAFHLETPRYGGHVGFVDRNASGEYWSERRAGDFLEDAVG
jgi:uncharacterized protein